MVNQAINQTINQVVNLTIDQVVNQAVNKKKDWMKWRVEERKKKEIGDNGGVWIM